MTFMTQPISAEEILKTGLLNQWYLVCRSEDVGPKPLGLTRLGRKLALWRDPQGAVHAVDDVCPHRRAPLSLGRVVAEGLACNYHGVVVDGTGTVVAVPPVHDCALVGKAMITGYPAREAAGAIWLYFADGLGGEVPELDLPEQLTSAEWSGFIYAAEWNCNYQLPLDNRLDPMHAIYLHAESFTLAYGVTRSVIELHETPTGFYIERDNQKGVNIDRTEVVHKPGNNYWVFTSIPYPKAAGGNFFTIISHLTPIDAQRTYLWVMRYQKSSGWRRNLWRFLYKNRLDQRHADVIEQDRVMIEGIAASDGAAQETMIQCDAGVARIRRTLAQEAARQAQAINRRHAPSAAQ
jgi:phenylpropionate dioxygenase-like ring-hydroxylating dioxygenase large terminal subunit